MTNRTKPIRVVHVVHGTFGHRFSGITHRLYSLLSGWRDPDVKLDLWGTELKPINMNSGDLEYRLPDGMRLWADAAVPGRFGRYWAAARRLATFVSRRGDFDIAHFYNSGWDVLLSPVIFHGIGKRAVFTTSLLGASHPGANNPGAVLRRRGGKFAFSLMRRFDGFVAVSPGLAEDCVRHGLSNVFCLPNFMAIAELEMGRNESLRAAVRARHRIPKEDTVLLCIGAANRRKGLDILVGSYVRVAESHPRTWLVLVGPSSEAEAGTGFDVAYVEEQRRRLREARLSDRVVWTGMVTDKRELAGYYSAADIFVLPTRAEGLSNVLVESAAAELPAVATHLPGITDTVVADGESGYLVPVDDVDAVTRGVGRLISDPSLRAAMSASARARSRAFGFDVYCRRLKDFYVHLMGAKSAEPRASALGGRGSSRRREGTPE